MIENNLYSKFNYNKVLTASTNKKQQTTTSIPQNGKDEFIKKKTKNQKTIPIITILGLGVALFAVLKYNNSKKLSLFNSTKFDRACFKLKSENKDKILNQKRLLNKNRLYFAKNKAIENFDNLADLISAEKAQEKIGKFSVPDVVFLSAVASEKDNYQRLFADYFDCETKTLEYSKGKLNEFLEYLKTFKDKTTDNNSKRMFVRIKNFQELLSEIETSGKENEKLAFSNFIKNCSKENKITMFLDDVNLQGLKKYKTNAMNIKIPCDISDKILEDDNLSMEISRLKNSNDLVRNMKVYPAQRNIADLLYDLQENGKTNILLENITEDEKSCFLNDLSKLFHCKQETFDVKEKTFDEFVQFIKKHKNNFEIGKDETILYLQNMEGFLSKNINNDDELSKLQGFLNTSFDNYGTRIVYDNFNDLPEKLSKIPCGIKKLNFLNPHTVFSRKNQEMLNLMAQNDFSAFPEHAIKSIEEFIHGIAFQQAGGVADEKVFNNILLYGKSEKTLDEGVQAIMNTFDANKQTINFDVKNPVVSIKEIADIVANGDEIFKKTGKRTLLFVKNLDEILTDYSTIEKKGLIGRIKTMIENTSEKHTNIIMTTTKPLNSFEGASIGGHRFGLKILLEKENI